MTNRIYFILAFFSFLAGSFFASAQDSSPNLELAFQWQDESLPGSTAFDNVYNEIWGFVANEREFAVIGSTMGTHIFDVTEPETADQVAFIEGAVTGPIIIHRDFHDYNGFLYIVADEGGGSTLQIVDVSQLPESFEVVYDSNELLVRSHNIFIDTATARLYSCGGSTLGSNGRLLMASLDDPANPVLIENYLNTVWGYVHDAYVRNDTAWLNAEDALYVVDFSDAANPEILGSFTDYPGLGYNHSGWLSADGLTYAMCDETHGTPVFLLDVSDLTDIQIASTVQAPSPLANSIAHNVMLKGRYMFVSYYYDGLQIYNITSPIVPCEAGYYDTSTQPFDNSYRGNWGLYCYLPSGLILASDMQEGLFVFRVVEAEVPELPCAIQPNVWIDAEPVSVELIGDSEKELISVYPTQFADRFSIEVPNDGRPWQAVLRAVDGRELAHSGEQTASRFDWLLDFEPAAGTYLLEIRVGDLSKTVRVVKAWR